ncbi:restriction endonuclease subunit S [Mesotoga prima]|uniref:restriction endonuclease subunit S n=1 Tax=Mesotoga prima TaxID=1184387 RepID=UPI002FE076F1
MRRGIPKSGDVLITSEAPLGEIAQLDNANIALAQRVIVLRGKSNLLDNTYLRYVLKSPSVMDEILSKATGTTVLGIKQSELKKVKIPLPSLSEQKLIGKMLFDLDERVDLNLKINNTLEEIARAIFKRWFIDFEFPNENGEPFKSSGGEMIDSPLGPIPKGWRVGNISDIANILGGGTPRTSIDEYWDGDIPFFTPKDAKALYCIHTEKCLTKKGLQSCSSRLYEKNTVFITARGTVGKLALAGTPMAMNQSCYALTGKEVSQYFLYFAIDNLVDSLKQSSHGAVFSTITTATLESTKALIPEARMERNFRDRIASRVSRKGGPPKDSMVIPLN